MSNELLSILEKYNKSGQTTSTLGQTNCFHFSKNRKEIRPKKVKQLPKPDFGKLPESRKKSKSRQHRLWKAARKSNRIVAPRSCERAVNCAKCSTSTTFANILRPIVILISMRRRWVRGAGAEHWLSSDYQCSQLLKVSHRQQYKNHHIRGPRQLLSWGETP